jgi:hypothetical protein
LHISGANVLFRALFPNIVKMLQHLLPLLDNNSMTNNEITAMAGQQFHKYVRKSKPEML